MSSEPALYELLDDLRHDLAKYLGLPLRMLPRDASATALRDALEDALLRTRRRGSQSLSAREIYQAGRAGLLAAGAAPERLGALDAAVDSALAWQAALAGDRALERAAIERDFAQVGAELDAWLAEVARG